jgi:hypothetical protein
LVVFHYLCLRRSSSPRYQDRVSASLDHRGVFQARNCNSAPRSCAPAKLES